MAKYIVEETKTSKYEKNFKFPLINLIPAIVWCIPVHQKLSPLAGTMGAFIVCCIIEIQKVAEQSAESCICILHKVAGFMERIAFDHYGIQVEPAFSP